MSLAFCNGHHVARTHRIQHGQDLPVFQWPWGRSFMDANVAARSCINPRHLRGEVVSDAIASTSAMLLQD
jgi:hypothetical protein